MEPGGLPSQYVDVFANLETPRTLYYWDFTGVSSHTHDPISDAFLEGGGGAESPQLVVRAWPLWTSPQSLEGKMPPVL